jgi:hypothetical protein
MFNARYSSRRAMIAALVEQVTLNHGSHRRVGRHVTEYATKNPRSEIPRQVRPLQTDQSVTNRRTPTLVMKLGTPRRAEK